jgi:hypothetical protein
VVNKTALSANLYGEVMHGRSTGSNASAKPGSSQAIPARTFIFKIAIMKSTWP